MIKRGRIPDTSRAAVWFIKWWREDGGLASASAPALPDYPLGAGVDAYRRGWGFDLEWAVDAADAGRYDERAIQAKMEDCIDRFEEAASLEEREGGSISSTQEKKRLKKQQKARQRARSKARLASRKSS